ncbi:ankyrin repeat-containing domain protein [Microdochium trichocladiopsis]|uniref:Ankyrin repeat-containing domain protein n=1 Tax=Microdochium trichocladiopsis TaxID=1682393 RepID=A0A9P8YKY8_9PEZI|nr:ankyrin repeat-containing domain protein [Microdochium trichocladiopsis]KAH7041431.1 ankyrin repeat-containing domain protein [Microdochium trichocladiopsis]
MLDLARRALELGLDPNEPAPGRTRNYYYDEHDLERDSHDYNGTMVLLIAVRRADLPLVSLLLQYGANPSAAGRDRGSDNNYSTPLITAARQDNLELFRLLISAHDGTSRKVTTWSRRSLLEMRDWLGRTALHEATNRGHDAIVRFLISRGSIVDARDSRAMTPLLCAIQKGHMSTVQVLLEAGADPWLHRDDWHGALDLAADAVPAGGGDRLDILRAIWLALSKPRPFGQSYDADWHLRRTHRVLAGAKAPAVKLLLDLGVDPDLEHKAERTPLMARAESISGNVDEVQLLIDAGADVNWSGPVDITTPLMVAVICGNVELARLLLARGAFADVRNLVGSSALNLAASQGSEPMVRLLVDHLGQQQNPAGATLADELKRTNNAGETPLMSALSASSSVVEIFRISRLLLEHGDPAAMANSTTNEGVTPLERAINTCDVRVLELLMDAGADIEALDSQGRTALAHAVSSLEQDMVRCLIERQPRPAHVNVCWTRPAVDDIPEQRLTPLASAAYSNAEQLVRILLGHGADVEFALGVDPGLMDHVRDRQAERGGDMLELLLEHMSKDLHARYNDPAWRLTLDQEV